ncbi:MAG: hypothetical protein K0R26_1391 [Bacteroidota bacterium]|jgi:hypothetical protein|nr:hypothetical protein [Bacteroidota bacterium]
MKKIRFSVIFTLCTFLLAAQKFTHQAAVVKVNKDSLYKIAVSPELRQNMTKDFHDVRIYDSKQNEIPYVVLSEPLLKSKSDFVAYEILSQKHFNSYSEIIIYNARQDKIGNIAFNINNSDAYKYCSIEGSDDLNQWYSVSELQELSLAYNETYTNQYKCIYFPANNYRYFRLSVDDWFAQPLKINSAGYFKNSVIAGKLNEVAFSKSITEVEKNKTTILKLSFKGEQTIHRLDFKIASPRLFMRHARVYAIREQKLKHKSEQIQETLYEFDLKSDEALWFDLPEITEKELFVEIQNKDNPPLQIESLSCKQLASYFVADLRHNESYMLKCGNKTLKLPEYDLVNFVSQSPQLLPEASIGELKLLPDQNISLSPAQEKSFLETPPFLWMCLSIGGLIIILFSRSLLKDMGKKEQ